MFPLPFVVVAQAGLMFFDLGFEFGEGFLAGSAGAVGGGGGVQGSGGERQIQREGVILGMLALRKGAVELHQIGFVRLEQAG